MKSADEYAFEADKRVSRTEGGSLARAQVYATLALAAATLEAARLMGPTPEDQARLDELISRKCQSVWSNAEADLPGFKHLAHGGTFHQCVYPAGHEAEEPHYCKCGSEMTSKAEDPSEEDLIRFEEALKDGTDNCPGCGCAPNVLGPDGVWVCEEYPGCGALMESPK